MKAEVRTAGRGHSSRDYHRDGTTNAVLTGIPGGAALRRAGPVRRVVLSADLGVTPMGVRVEELDGALWLTGNVHPDEEQRLVTVLGRYLKAGHGNPRVLELSGVGYIPSSTARALLVEAEHATGTVTIRSSVPVVRTFEAIGVPEGIEIETCRTPNRKSMAATADATGGTTIQSGSATQRISRFPASSSSAAIQPAEKEPAAEPAPGPPPGKTLANEDEDLPAALSVLRKLTVMKIYSFRLPGLAGEITGRVIGRIGGPWILIETHGARKMVNLDMVGSVDVLS